MSTRRPEGDQDVVVRRPDTDPVPPPQPEPPPSPGPQPTPAPPHPDPNPPQAVTAHRVDQEWRSDQPGPASLALRITLTLAGAVMLVISPWLDWVGSRAGADTTIEAYWRATLGSTGRLVESAGIVMVVLGGLALIGLAFKTGWLSRVAGALGILALVLFTITVGRTDAQLPGDLGPGVWVALVGTVLLLIAGFVAPVTARRKRTTGFDAD